MMHKSELVVLPICNCREFPVRCTTDCGIVPLWVAAFPPFFAALMVDLAPLLRGFFVRASPLRCVQPTVRLGVGEVGLPLTIWPLGGSPHQTVWTN
jgi:hypothetical protein